MIPMQTISPYSITTQFHITTIEKPELIGPQDQKSGLGAMPQATGREAKEKQDQKWPGKSLLPNFSTNIKV